MLESIYHFLQTHNLFLVILSYAIAAITAYVSFSLVERVKTSASPLWQALGACMSGIGLWSMHFIAMLSTPHANGFTFDVGITIASLLVAVGVAYASIRCIGAGKPSWRRIACASLLFGTGAFLMHFIGVAAVEMPKRFDGFFVALTAVVGWTDSLVAYSIAFRWANAVRTRPTKFASSMLMGIGMLAMHSTGMAGTTFVVPAPAAASGAVETFALDHVWMGLTIAFVTILAMMLSMIAIYVNRLAERDREHRSMFEDSPDVILLVDRAGVVRQVNRAVTKVLGYEPGDVEQRPVESLAADEGREALAQAVRETLEGRSAEAETTLLHSNGAPVFGRIKTIPIVTDHRDKGFYIVVQDVTEAKTLRQYHRMMQSQFHSVVETALDAIVVTDERQHILVWNEGARVMFGYTKEEALGKYGDFLIPERYRPSYFEGIEAFFRSDERRAAGVTREIHALRKNGEEFPAEISVTRWTVDQSAFYSAFIRDVSQRKQMERALVQSEERYRKLIDSFPEAIFIGKGDRMIYANDVGIRLLGAHDLEDVLRYSAFEIVHPDYHPNVRKRIQVTENLKRETERMEEKWIRPDGEEIHVEVSAIPATLEDGTQTVRVVLVRDMTELRKARDLFERAEKLAVAGELAAGVAHEIRNPLTAVKGFLQLMSEERVPPYYDLIRTELQRIEAVISELLMIAKPEQTRYARRDIGEIVAQAIPQLEAEAEAADVVIVADIDAAPCYVLCDEQQIRLALVNMMRNGIEAMEGGGTLRVVVRPESRVAASIRIIDEGAGISPERIDRLGEPFYTTKAKGTGLGLLISFKIIRNHQGQIDVVSKLREGTTFTVTLPIADDAQRR